MIKNLFADLDLQRRATIPWRPPELPNLSAAHTIFLDTETTGLRWWKDRAVGVALATLEGDNWYLPTGHRGGGNLSEENVKAFLRDALRGKKVIGHNIKFDNHILFSGWDLDLEALGCQLYDTQHLVALLEDHRLRFDLDTVAKDFLGADVGKLKQTSFTNQPLDAGRMAEYHAGEVAAYAQQDVLLTKDLWAKLLPQIEEQNLREVLELESELVYTTCELERNPSRLDLEKLDRWIRETEKELEDKVLFVMRETGVSLEKVDSPKAWADIFRRRGLEEPAERTEKKDEPSFAGDVLKRYQDTVVQAGLRAKEIHSLRTKYLLPYRDRSEGGRLRTAFHQLKADEGGTISGRYSSSAYKFPDGTKIGANLQQVFAVEKQQKRFGDRYIIRELFLPEEGQLWFAADAAQIEYRLFAHYANSPKILSVYEKDPNADYHAMVWEMLKPFKEGLTRKPVKNVNFAKIYGAGEEKIAAMLELPLAESNKFVRIYDRELPEAAKLLDQASGVARRRGYVKTLLGRRSRFGRDKRTGFYFTRYHKALNAVIQGTAGDVAKRKAIEVYKERKRLGIRLQLTVHDELDGSSPDQQAAVEVSRVLNVQSFDLRVPILWSMEVGENWAHGSAVKETEWTEEVRRVDDPARRNAAQKDGIA